MDSRLVEAEAAFAKGRRAEAIDLIIDALDANIEPSLKIYGMLLNALLVLCRYEEGAGWAVRALQIAPSNYELLNYHGIFLRRCGRYGEALAVLDRAIALNPGELAAQVNKGNIYNDMRDGARAEAIFTRLLIHNPNSAAFLRSLGLALRAQNKFDQAALRMREAIKLQNDNVGTWLELSEIQFESGSPEACLETLNQALTANPRDMGLLRAKSGTYRRLGRNPEAQQFLESLTPPATDQSWYHQEFGCVLSDIDRNRANEHFRMAVALDPDNIDARLALVASLDRTRQGEESASIEEAYRLLTEEALPSRLAPEHYKVITEVLTRSADYEAVEKLGDSRQLGQIWATNSLQSALLGQMARTKSPDDRRELLRHHRLWGDAVIERARRNPITRLSDVSGSSKIRVGFMSSDLRKHVVTNFAWPLFEYADRDRFDIYCYSFYAGKEADTTQQFIASRVNAFRWHPAISDHDAAQLIANDQLDILFELGGATHMNKIEVMAWKPAPLTVSWLGYPHSSGLNTIDYLLLDPYLNPPDPALLIEKPLIMPRTWIALGEKAYPDLHMIEDLAPVRRNGHITFGTANNPYKYNANMLRTWARVMARIPEARFIFVRPEAGSKVFTANIRRYCEAEGVNGERIEFRPIRGAHMPHYNDIDIALDTFPHTGGTTTCDALWMGVPTVSLVGEALFERLSYSILQNAGLSDLCATTTEQYIDIAVALAANTDRLQALRTGLRDQIRASPLGQTRQFARDFYDLVARTVAAHARTAPLP